MITQVCSVEGGRGRKVLSWLGWRGKRSSAWQCFQAQTSGQCRTLDGVFLWDAVRAGGDLPFARSGPLKCCSSGKPPPRVSSGKHSLLSSSFQLHKSGVSCELARVWHNWGVSTLPALGDATLSNVSGGAMETRWRQVHSNLEVLLSPAGIQI